MGDIVFYDDEEIFDILEGYGTDQYGMVMDLERHTDAMLAYDRWANFLTDYPSTFEDHKAIYIKAANEMLEEWPVIKEALVVSQVLDVQQSDKEDYFTWTFEVA